VVFRIHQEKDDRISAKARALTTLSVKAAEGDR